MRFYLCLFVWLSTPVFAQKDASLSDDKTKSIMHGIYANLSELLPLSMNPQTFSDPSNRKAIKGYVDALSGTVGQLRVHAKSKNPGFMFLSDSLSRDLSEIKKWYDLGRDDEARFVIHNLTEYCISCHTQQRGNLDFVQASDLFKKVEVSKLSLVEKAQLLVATRQFDEAMKTYEEFFKSNELTPAQMALMQAFPDYLKVAVRVRGDLKRPIPVLEQWGKRDGVPPYMQAHIKEWIDALKTIDKQKLFTPPTLASAKKLMRLGQADLASTKSREKLIYFISASALLSQVVNNKDTKPEEFAEAYYLLGLCESVIGRTFWISQTEFYLESAIKGAPGTRIAQKAYRELESQIYGEYSGSSGTNIPEDVDGLLKELKAIAFSDKSKTAKETKKK